LIGLSVLGLVAIFSVIGWGDAAAWYPVEPESAPAQLELPEAPWGAYALRLISARGQPTEHVRQFILGENAALLEGKPVTLGAWIWASAPGSAVLPHANRSDGPALTVTVGTTPVFYSTTFTLVSSTSRLAVDIAAPANPTGADVRSIYYDGLI